eukprot:4068139-Amphidinium_carterae.1
MVACPLGDSVMQPNGGGCMVACPLGDSVMQPKGTVAWLHGCMSSGGLCHATKGAGLHDRVPQDTCNHATVRLHHRVPRDTCNHATVRLHDRVPQEPRHMQPCGREVA